MLRHVFAPWHSLGESGPGFRRANDEIVVDGAHAGRDLRGNPNGFFSDAESTMPHSSTAPSCTITLIRDGLVQGSALSCEITFSRIFDHRWA